MLPKETKAVFFSHCDFLFLKIIKIFLGSLKTMNIQIITEADCCFVKHFQYTELSPLNIQIQE